MKQTVTGLITEPLDDKRCYLPIKIKGECPHCGSTIERDLNDDYLSYPDFSEPIEVDFYCWKCEESSSLMVDFNIKITAEFDISKLKKT